MVTAVDLPEGEVTFLFTDVQGSTRLLEEHPAAYGEKIARHHELLAAAVTDRRGVVFETIGDAVYAAFSDPRGAVGAAVAGQRALAAEDWAPLAEIKVRMGVHTGRVERRATHYFGPALYRCARLTATAHGGQVVLSEVTATLVRDSLDGTLIDLGSHQLKDLRDPERVFQVAGEGLESEFPPLRSAGGRPNNLPAEVKSFVGRRAELSALCELAVEPGIRAITITGPGGAGKTRLALRAAEQLLEPFKDGVFFVPLASLAGAELVTSAVANVLGVQKAADRTLVESLVTHLAGKELLLVLDNFEHVLPAAQDVAAVLASAPNVRVLATSRVPLRIQGEHEYHVRPLEPPAPDAPLEEATRSPAVQLFVERAREIRDDFALTDASAQAVGEICRQLDGLPLAIELAASRIRMLSPQAMLERIEDRLGLLTDGPADLPSRQQTLRQTIQWSYDLLSEPERALVRQLAVFRGGCTLAAAETLCGAGVFSSLSTLVEHSLVETRWNELGDTRYEQLETIAEFAREELRASEEADALAARHAEHFASYGEQAEEHLYSDARAPWLLRLDEDRDNFRAALAWSVEHDRAEPGLRILASLWLWWWTAFSEGRAWAERVLALPSAAEPTRARAGTLFTAEICSVGAGDIPETRRYADEALAVSRSLGEERWFALAQAVGAGALAGLQSAPGIVFDDPEGPQRVQEFGTEAIAVAERGGDPWVIAWVTMISGYACLLSGNPVAAEPWSASAVASFEQLGDSWSRATASVVRAFSLVQLGELEAAGKALEGSVDALRSVRDLKMANAGLIANGLVARLTGDLESSEARYREALAACVEVGDPANGPVCLEGVAAAVAARDPERGTRLLGAAKALFDSGAFPTVPGFEVFYQGTRAMLTDALGEDDVVKLETLGAEAARTRPLAELVQA
jgi:predicted ATPase/class 3 adenylate cyclase